MITDRRVLDAQLQRQVRAFAQTSSAVQEIYGRSQQLLDALTDTTARVVITTLRKFPVVLGLLSDDADQAAALKDRRYAVIVDEAHSSQSGQAAVDLKQVIGARAVDDLDPESEDVDGVPTALLAGAAGGAGGGVQRALRQRSGRRRRDSPGPGRDRQGRGDR